MYVDIIETLSITAAPSGRYLSALAFGTIAFTAKVSGTPDLILLLSAPGGVGNVVGLPVFHPCVRLGRWREKPGDLSFIPPDGKFNLAGYEVDLMASSSSSNLEDLSSFTATRQNLNLPVTIAVRTSLGPAGSDFEVRLGLSSSFRSPTSSTAESLRSSASSASSRPSVLPSRSASVFTAGGTSAHPLLEDITVHIPLPAGVRMVIDLKTSKGEATYSPGDAEIVWSMSTRDIQVLINGGNINGRENTSVTLVGTVVGAQSVNEETDELVDLRTANKWDYDEAEEISAYYQSSSSASAPHLSGTESDAKKHDELSNADAVKIKANKSLMPASVTASFQVKGWLASGIKVEKLTIDPNRSKGLGTGVTPYKGVKYLTVSRKGLEVRC
jgi:AP-3 complex subunit mu